MRKSSLPAIRKMTVVWCDMRVKPRARRLAAWNRPLSASRKPLVWRVCAQATMPSRWRRTRAGDVLHRFDLGAHDAGAPVLQHGAHDVDLLALEDLAQLLLVDPGARGAHGGHLGDQGVEIGGGLGTGWRGPSAATSAGP